MCGEERCSGEGGGREGRGKLKKVPLALFGRRERGVEGYRHRSAVQKKKPKPRMGQDKKKKQRANRLSRNTKASEDGEGCYTGDNFSVGTKEIKPTMEQFGRVRGPQDRGIGTRREGENRAGKAPSIDQ